MIPLTKQNWQKIYVSGICIGVGNSVRSVKGEEEQYEEVVCNSILPETDQEYDEQEEKIESIMSLISAAPDLLEILQRIISTEEISDSMKKKAFKVLQKARGEDQ